MSSFSQCKRFSQNAWKKDLCSNCFKSKEEHKKPESTNNSSNKSTPVKPVPNADIKPKCSILKGSKIVSNNSGSTNEPSLQENGSKIKSEITNSLKVKFSEVESEIIGYGGDGDEFDSSDDSCDEDEEKTDSSNGQDTEDPDNADLQRLTKLNTDFNSVTSNLIDNNVTDDVGAPKKNNLVSLRLGQPKVGSDGQKQTLLVSVQPFGSDNSKINFKDKKYLVDDDKNDMKFDSLNDHLDKIDKKHTKLNLSNKNGINNGKTNGVKDCNPNLTDDKDKSNDKNNENPDHDIKSIQNGDNHGGTNKNNNTVTSDTNSTTNEVRKGTQITRGTVITKSHEHVKSKLFPLIDSNKSLNKTDPVNSASDLNYTNLNKPLSLTLSPIDKINGIDRKIDNNISIDNCVFSKISGKENIKNVNENKITAVEKNVTRQLLSESNVTNNKYATGNIDINVKTQHKNYKNNIVSSDDDIKCLSFKEYGDEGHDSINPDRDIKVRKSDMKNANIFLTCDKFNKNTENKKLFANSDNNSKSFLPCHCEEDRTSPPLTSRELAGEPDGMAADTSEIKESTPVPPILMNLRTPPTTPPPPPPSLSLNLSDSSKNTDLPSPRTSFLHSLQQRSETPQSPTSPTSPKLSIGSFSSTNSSDDNPPSPNRLSLSLAGGINESSSTDEDVNLVIVDEILYGDGLQQPLNIIKRQAPKPPASPLISSSSITFSQNTFAAANVLTTCSEQNLTGKMEEVPVIEKRNSTPVSNDYFTKTTFSVSKPFDTTPSPTIFYGTASTCVSANKRGSKMRSTLRKLLRFGSKNDEDIVMDSNGFSGLNDGKSSNVATNNGSNVITRIRPEIIHPLDLNKSAVEVLSNNSSNLDQYYRVNKVEESPNRMSAHVVLSPTGRPNKPPPPPRSHSLDMSISDSLMRAPAPPARPPPPLSAAVKHRSHPNKMDSNTRVNSSDYVNVEFKRKGVESESLNKWKGASMHENVNLVDENCSPTIVRGKSNMGAENKKSLSTEGITSLLMQQPTAINNYLEDNYKAIVVLNLSTLCRLFQQVNLKTSSDIDTLLKSKESTQWSNFIIDETVESVCIGCRKFYKAHRKTDNLLVTICINLIPSDDLKSLSNVKLPNGLDVAYEFVDLVPNKLIDGLKKSEELIKVTISVLPCQTVLPLLNCASIEPSFIISNELNKINQPIFLMYLLISCLNSMKDKSINSFNKSDIVLCKFGKYAESKIQQITDLKVSLLPHNSLDTSSSSEEVVELCQYLNTYISKIQMPYELNLALKKIDVGVKKDYSLTKVKEIVEFWLWVPEGFNNELSSILAVDQRLLSIQRWLDLERAKLLESLLNSVSPLELNSYQYSKLSFFATTNAKTINDSLSFLSDAEKHSTSIC